MPDWAALLRAKLNLEAGSRRDVLVGELAGHLEDEFQHLCGTMSEEAAAHRLTRWLERVDLTETLCAAEEEANMNNRTRMLWIPGMTALLLSGLLLRWLYGMGTWYEVFWFNLAGGASFGLVVYPYWLASLPVFGAMGAYLAQRAGASASARVLAGLFPAAAMAALFSLLTPLAFVADPHVPILLKIEGMGLFILQWVFIPGATLFLGTMPFLFSRRTPEMHLA